MASIEWRKKDYSNLGSSYNPDLEARITAEVSRRTAAADMNSSQDNRKRTIALTNEESNKRTKYTGGRTKKHSRRKRKHSSKRNKPRNKTLKRK